MPPFLSYVSITCKASLVRTYMYTDETVMWSWYYSFMWLEVVCTKVCRMFASTRANCSLVSQILHGHNLKIKDYQQNVGFDVEMVLIIRCSLNGVNLLHFCVWFSHITFMCWLVLKQYGSTQFHHYYYQVLCCHGNCWMMSPSVSGNFTEHDKPSKSCFVLLFYKKYFALTYNYKCSNLMHQRHKKHSQIYKILTLGDTFKKYKTEQKRWKKVQCVLLTIPLQINMKIIYCIF